MVKEFWRSVRIWQSYGEKIKWHLFSGHGVVMQCWEQKKRKHETQRHRLLKCKTLWASAAFFSGVGNEGVWMTEVPRQLGSRAAPRWGSGGKAPEADDIFSKWCINTSSTEVLDNICSKKTLFNISRGRGKCPPCPCPRASMQDVHQNYDLDALDWLRYWLTMLSLFCAVLVMQCKRRLNQGT